MCEKYSEHRKYNTYDLKRTKLQEALYEAKKREDSEIGIHLRENEILQIVNSKQDPCNHSGIAIRKDHVTLEAVKSLIEKKLLSFVSFQKGKDFILVRARYI